MAFVQAVSLVLLGILTSLESSTNISLSSHLSCHADNGLHIVESSLVL